MFGSADAGAYCAVTPNVELPLEIQNIEVGTDP